MFQALGAIAVKKTNKAFFDRTLSSDRTWANEPVGAEERTGLQRAWRTSSDPEGLHLYRGGSSLMMGTRRHYVNHAHAGSSLCHSDLPWDTKVSLGLSLGTSCPHIAGNLAH